MYTCPTDDIHSIYLDKELPFIYLKEYEAHVQSCLTCRQKLEHLRSLKNLFAVDCKNITLDSNFKKDSFERLQTKMRYSNNTRTVHNFPSEYLRYGIGAVAAVIVAVVIPVRSINSKNVSFKNNQIISQITPIERPQSTSISYNNIVINGNINDNLAHNVSSGNFTNPRFADVDVFRPEFDKSNVIPFKMDVPNFEYRQSRPPRFQRIMEEEMDFRFPVTDIQGNNRE